MTVKHPEIDGLGQLPVLLGDFVYWLTQNGCSGPCVNVFTGLVRSQHGFVLRNDSRCAQLNLGVFSDDELGRFVDVKTLVQIRGDMTLKVNGMELPGKLDHTIGNHSVELAKKK